MDRKDSTPSIKDFKGSMSGLNIAESSRTIVSNQEYELPKQNKATSTERSSRISNQPRKSMKRFNVLCGWVSLGSSDRDEMEPNTKSSQTSFSEEEEQNFEVKI